MWCEKHPNKIRVIEKKNSGSLLTRKRCIEESISDYLYIMDSDDVLINKDAFKIIVERIQISNADLIFFDSRTDNGSLRTFPFSDGEIFENESLKKVYDVFLKSADLYPLWNKVFRKELVDFNTDYQDCEDIVYGTDLYQTIPILCRAKKITYINECLYNYRYEGNANSIVHKFKPESYITAKKNQLRLEQYAREYMSDVDDLEIKLATNRMIRISTAIYKGRMISDNSTIDKYEYFKSIGEDEYFRQNYSKCIVPLSRRLLLELTYHRKYWLLSRIL